MELTCAEGEGGGPDKTILLGAAQADPQRYAITVCYVVGGKGGSFGIAERARALGVQVLCLEERSRFDLAVWRAMRQLVRDRQIDIVHAHGYKADLYASLLARKEGVIPLATVHGFTGHTWRERFLYYPLDRRLLARFPKVIAVSSELRNTLLRAGARPEQVETILNGIDPRVFRRCPDRVPEYRSSLGVAPGEIVLGTVGRLERQKRFDVLLGVLAELLPSRPQLRLLVAGEGSLGSQLKQLAERLGVAHACRFLGHRRDVDRIYQAMDVFVQSSDYEGTPNVVLEAMAFETPVVATDVGGTTELIENGSHALVVPPRRPDLLARAILEVIQDPAATKRRVAAARARVEQEFSFEARMRAVERVYESLMLQRGQG